MAKKQIKTYHSFSFIAVVLFCLQIYHVSGMECGRTAFISPRILGGVSVSKGEYPFIAALYRVKQSEYFCGGTIISRNHVLTAANCIRGKASSRNLLPEDIVVKLGAHNLTKENETDSVRMYVSQIVVHPDWNIYSDDYDADVAILVLSDNITFTNFISPVCLPADKTEVSEATINLDGKIVGWGLVENKRHEAVPTQAEIKAINATSCFLSDSGTVHLSSTRTFCGGHGEGTPNLGDAGGGFFVDTDSGWVQYGIISASRTNLRGQIVRSSYSIYGNVKSFKKWIAETTQINFDSLDDQFTFY